MRRRNLLTGALAAGATAAFGAPAANAAPTTGDPAAPLEDYLFRLPSAAPVPLPRLVQETSSARADFRAARYSALGRALPSLLAAASGTWEESTGHERDKIPACGRPRRSGAFPARSGAETQVAGAQET